MNTAQALQDALNEAYLKLPQVNRETYPVQRANITYSVNGANGSLQYTVTFPIVTASSDVGALSFATENWLPA